MSSGHLGMKWSLFIWVWIVAATLEIGLSTVSPQYAAQCSCCRLALSYAAQCSGSRPAASRRSVVVAHSSVASVASLPAPASLMLDRSSRRLSGAPHAPAKPFDQKLTSALCAVWWKECAIDVSLHTHRYECIYHRYLLRHRPICHHVRWLVCDSSLTLTAWR